MTDTSEQVPPVKAVAVLIDPATMTVVWTNDPTAAVPVDGTVSGLTVDRVVPMAAVLGVDDALRDVARTGAPRHLRSDVVSMGRGSIAMAASVFRLPDGMLLLLTENAWHAKPRGSRAR